MIDANNDDAPSMDAEDDVEDAIVNDLLDTEERVSDDDASVAASNDGYVPEYKPSPAPLRRRRESAAPATAPARPPASPQPTSRAPTPPSMSRYPRSIVTEVVAGPARQLRIVEVLPARRTRSRSASRRIAPVPLNLTSPPDEVEPKEAFAQAGEVAPRGILFRAARIGLATALATLALMLAFSRVTGNVAPRAPAVTQLRLASAAHSAVAMLPTWLVVTAEPVVAAVAPLATIAQPVLDVYNDNAALLAAVFCVATCAAAMFAA